MNKVTIKYSTTQELQLPKELAAAAGLVEGQEALVQSSENGLLICKTADADTWLDMARQVMDTFDEELRILAKK